MKTALLQPVVALVLWTFVMWTWMYATRIPAIQRAKMKLDPTAPRGEQMASLPASVRWKADNYNHLFEQPTLFYAVAITLALAGGDDTTNVALAWSYVGLRVLHSIWQSTRNVIEVRFAFFLLSSLVLLALSVRAATAVFASPSGLWGAGPACPPGELALTASVVAPGLPSLPGGLTLARMRATGEIEDALTTGKTPYVLHPEGCLTYDGKLVVELMPDGRLLTASGELFATRTGDKLVFPHGELTTMADGTVTMKFDAETPTMPTWRFEGLDPQETCAAEMLIAAQFRSMSGANMAVVDGVAKRPQAVPPSPESPCKHLPR